VCWIGCHLCLQYLSSSLLLEKLILQHRNIAPFTNGLIFSSVSEENERQQGIKWRGGGGGERDDWRHVEEKLISNTQDLPLLLAHWTRIKDLERT
jgi:hypothetical protein